MTGFKRRDVDRRGADRRVAERRDSESRKTLCPKCGTWRVTFTAGVTSGSDHLSLFRCEVCAFRFMTAGITTMWQEPDQRASSPGFANG